MSANGAFLPSMLQRSPEDQSHPTFSSLGSVPAGH